MSLGVLRLVAMDNEPPRCPGDFLLLLFFIFVIDKEFRWFIINKITKTNQNCCHGNFNQIGLGLNLPSKGISFSKSRHQ